MKITKIMNIGITKRLRNSKTNSSFFMELKIFFYEKAHKAKWWQAYSLIGFNACIGCWKFFLMKHDGS